MGLGIGAQPLRKFTGPAQSLHKPKEVPTFNSVIVDCCAVGRKLSSGRDASAATLARQIACNSLMRLGGEHGRKLVVFCFDASNLHTPMREVCSARRYARPTAQRIAQAQPQIASGAMELHNGRLYRPDDAPYPDAQVDTFDIQSVVKWNKLFNSARGKTAAWHLIEEALKQYIATLAGTLADGTTPFEQVRVVLDGASDATSQSFKRGQWSTKRNLSNYGEADLKLQAWTERVATETNPALLITIDSDAVAIAMCNNSPVTVELARVWRDSTGKQYYSSAAAKKAKAGASLVELVDIPILHAGRTDTLMRVAMVLIAGGCDYSTGLLCCGLLKDSVLAVATGPPLDHLWMWQDEDALFVDVGALLSWIRSLKKRKTRKGTTTLIFCRELHRILWTVAYWCGCGRDRFAWGPPVDLGLGGPRWIHDAASDISSVDALIATAADSTGPCAIGTMRRL